MTKKRHDGISTLDKARKLWRVGLLKDRPTAKTDFTAGQRSYITKLANKFANEIAKPEQFVFKKVSAAQAKQLAGVNFKTANNVVPIRAPFGAKVRVTRESITVENIFEKNTIFLTPKAFTQRAGKFRAVDEDDDFTDYSDPSTYEGKQNYWRFADGSDVSSKMYPSLDQAISELQNYPRETSRKVRNGALPVFSQQKLSGLTGFDQGDILRAKQSIIEQIPAGTVRKSGKAKKRAK